MISQTIPIATADEHEEFKTGFWQHYWAQNILPFCTSLALHGCIILLGLLTIKAVVQVMTPIRVDQILPTDGGLYNEGTLEHIVHQGLGTDPTRAARQDIDDSVPANSTGIAEKKGIRHWEMGGAAGDVTNSMISIGINHAFGKGKGKTGTGTGDNILTGDLAPFGMPGGGVGIQSKIFPRPNVLKFAYVCDASGSMLGQQFDLLKEEINRSVEVLPPNCCFDVIFFKNSGCEALSLKTQSSRLMMANPDNKDKTLKFLHDVETGPDSDPIPALRHAFKLQPELIYLLTDGAFADNQAVREECRRLNSGGKVKINTIAFFRQNIEPSDRKLCEEVLSTIAQENHGTFRVVWTTDLVKR